MVKDNFENATQYFLNVRTPQNQLLKTFLDFQQLLRRRHRNEGKAHTRRGNTAAVEETNSTAFMLLFYVYVRPVGEFRVRF